MASPLSPLYLFSPSFSFTPFTLFFLPPFSGLVLSIFWGAPPWEGSPS